MSKFCLGLVVALCVCFLGCFSDGPRLVQVRGKITYEGKPATTGAITFQPEPGQAEELQPTTGVINSDGTYSMASIHGKGIPPGKYLVAITSMEPVDLENPVQKWLIPEKYSNPSTSGQKAEIPASGPSSVELNFDLP